MDNCSRLDEPRGVEWKDVNVGLLRTARNGKRLILQHREAARSDRSPDLKRQIKRTIMNQLPMMLSLVLLVALPETSVTADTNLHAARKAAEPDQIFPGPTGTCSIYIQGRYSECEFTTEHGCQKLSEVRNRPPKIALRRWYALPQEGWGWDQPRCAGKVPKSSLY
jgi:hypothetical protein